MLRCVKTPTCETVICHWFPTMPQTFVLNSVMYFCDTVACGHLELQRQTVSDGCSQWRWNKAMAQFSLQVTLEINLVLERLIMFLSKTLVTVWWERTFDLFQRRQYSSEAVCTSNPNKYNIPVMTCCMQPAQPPCFTFWRLWTSTNLLNSFKLCFGLSSLEGEKWARGQETQNISAHPTSLHWKPLQSH